MQTLKAAFLMLSCLLAAVAAAQDVATYKSAVVALTDDAELRQSFERELVTLGRSHGYDAVTSYDIMEDVRTLSNRAFLNALRAHDVQVVLMVRPAAVGEGASLESVREEISPRQFADMQRFARQVGNPETHALIAVVHLGIYVIASRRAEMISSGAVWLDEPVADRDEGIRRLQALIVQNIDAVRPQIRRRLGLPPLP